MKNAAAIAAIIATLLTAGTALAVTAYRMGVLAERVAQAERRTSEELKTFATAPREPGAERRFSNTGSRGDWSDAVYCPSSQYVCGLRQRIDSGVSSGVAFYCCPLDPD